MNAVKFDIDLVFFKKKTIKFANLLLVKIMRKIFIRKTNPLTVLILRAFIQIFMVKLFMKRKVPLEHEKVT